MSLDLKLVDCFDEIIRLRSDFIVAFVSVAYSALLDGTGSVIRSVSHGAISGSDDEISDEGDDTGKVYISGVTMTEESSRALENQENAEPAVSPEEVALYSKVKGRRSAAKSKEAKTQVG